MSEKYSTQVGTKHVQKMNKMASYSSQKPMKYQSAKKKRGVIPKWDGLDVPTIGVNATRLGGKSVCKGGHPPYTIELSNKEAQYILHSDITADRNGNPLNCMATVHISDVGLDKEPFREFTKSLARKFNQYGRDLYGIGIYERRCHDEAEDREMHLHFWFHCPRDLTETIGAFVKAGSTQKTDRQFRTSHTGMFGYLTKCHRSMNPAYARRQREREYYRYFNRAKGDFIKGRRYHLSTPLARIVDLPYPPSIRVMPKRIAPRNNKEALGSA
jgi:hypothetical protein